VVGNIFDILIINGVGAAVVLHSFTAAGLSIGANMLLIVEELGLNQLIRSLPTKTTSTKLQPTFYRALLDGPVAALSSRCDSRSDVTSVAILGYN
jgi:hypothetical protein